MDIQILQVCLVDYKSILSIYLFDGKLDIFESK